MIPTSEEVLLTLLSDLKEDNMAEYLSNHPEDLEYHSRGIKELVKLHVKAALKAASEKADLTDDRTLCGNCNMCHGECLIVNKESILSAYPLSNIQ